MECFSHCAIVWACEKINASDKFIPLIVSSDHCTMGWKAMKSARSIHKHQTLTSFRTLGSGANDQASKRVGTRASEPDIEEHADGCVVRENERVYTSISLPFHPTCDVSKRGHERYWGIQALMRRFTSNSSHSAFSRSYLDDCDPYHCKFCSGDQIWQKRKEEKKTHIEPQKMWIELD